MDGNKASSLTRRSFLKAGALTAGAAAVVGTSGCTTIAEQSEEAVVQAAEEKTFTNWCRGNCGDFCSLTGLVREGKLVKTSPTVLPTEARLMQRGCVRGQTGPQRIYAPNRVLYPMKQTGERGSDNWERITWDEACQTIAEKFNAATEEFGPSSVVTSFGCAGTGLICAGQSGYSARNRFATNGLATEMFLRRTGYAQTLFSSDALGTWMANTICAQPSNSIEDTAHSKAVFFFGINPAESCLRSWPYICQAHEGGAKLVTIDPRFSKTAAASDVHVPVRPGTDSALILAMANYLIDNNLYNEDYLRNGSVAPFLVKEDGSYLRLSDLGMDPVDVTNAVTGKTEATDTEVVYDEAAGTFGSYRSIQNPAYEGEFDADGIKVQTVFNMVRDHIKPYTAEFAAEECGISIDLINEVSRIYAENRPCKIFTMNGFAHITNSYLNYFGIGLLVALTGDSGVKGGGYGQLGIFTEGSTCMKAPVSINYSAMTVENPQYNFVFTTEFLPQVLETGKWKGEDFPVKCFFNSHQNLLGSEMGPTYMKQAFEKIGFVVVADPCMTYTARWADIVLPISLSWEDEDLNVDGVAMQKAVEPLGECKSQFDMLVALADALGYDDLYTKSQQDYLRDLLDTPENLEAGLGYDAWKEQGTIYGEYKYGEIITPETNPTGRTIFYVEKMIPNCDYGQTFELNQRMPGYEHASESYKDNPLREKYPLHGIGHYHDSYTAQTFMGNVPWLEELRGEPSVLIHPNAAAERGIQTGDTVKIYNDHGYVVCKAILTMGVREDTIVAPHGYDHAQYIEGDPQDLVGLVLEPIACNNNYNDWLCQIEKM